MKSLLSAAMIGVLCFTLSAASQVLVVNIDFDYVNDGGETYSGQGAYADTGNNYWNVIKSTNVSSPPVFKASDGTTDTSITFVFNNTVNFSSGGSPDGVAGNLMQDYLYTKNTSSSPIGFTIGGLTAGANYEIYIYSAVGGNNSVRNRQAAFAIDGNTLNVNGYSSATQNGSLYTSFVDGDNYLKFSINPTGTSVNGSYYTTSNEAEFNGLQIVQTAVPEPSTYAAIFGILALVATGVIRRRRAITA